MQCRNDIKITDITGVGPMTILKILPVVFTGFFAFQASAQISSTFSGQIGSGQLDSYPQPDLFEQPLQGTPTLSVNLAGAPYIIELTYSGDPAPATSNGLDFANWSGPMSASYFIYSPENTSELLVSGVLSETTGALGVTKALVTITQEEQEVPGSSPTVTATVDVEQVSGTDSISWALNAPEGSLSVNFSDESNSMVNDVTVYPSAPATFTSSAISLNVDNASFGGEDIVLSLSASEQHIVINGDLDGDGIADTDDEFPTDPTESKDTDKDGIGDNSDVWKDDPLRWSDVDEDGFSDQVIPPSEFPEDGFPNDPTRWLDEDGDGASEHDFTDDGIDNPEDAFPGDSLRWTDLDGDGFSDQIIPPSEYPEDMFPTDPGEWSDLDLDGYGDSYDKCDASNTDPNAPVAIDLDGLDIEITNRYLTKGCWMADAVEILINRADKGNSGVAIATSYLVQAGEISGQQKGQIVSSAAKKIEERENKGNGNANAANNGNSGNAGNSNGNAGGNSSQNNEESTSSGGETGTGSESGSGSESGTGSTSGTGESTACTQPEEGSTTGTTSSSESTGTGTDTDTDTDTDTETSSSCQEESSNNGQGQGKDKDKDNNNSSNNGQGNTSN